MTTPTQETGQPLDFTRPLELVCDGTEVEYRGDFGTGNDARHLIARADGKGFTPEQHPRGTSGILSQAVTKDGRSYFDPTGPQIVRNRAEANTPVQGDGLVERVADAMRNAVIRDDEGEFPRLFDLLDFSGENKARTVVNGLARAAISAVLAHQPTTDAEAEPVAWTGSGSLIALQDGREGFIWPTCAAAHPVPLYAHPPADKARIAELEDALQAIARFVPKEHPAGRHSEDVSGWNRAGNYVAGIARAALENRHAD